MLHPKSGRPELIRSAGPLRVRGKPPGSESKSGLRIGWNPAQVVQIKLAAFKLSQLDCLDGGRCAVMLLIRQCVPAWLASSLLEPVVFVVD